MDCKHLAQERVHSCVSFGICTNSHNFGFQQRNIFIRNNFSLQQTNQKIPNSRIFYTFFLSPRKRIIYFIFYIFLSYRGMSQLLIFSVHISFFKMLVWYINRAWHWSYYLPHRLIGTLWNSLFTTTLSIHWQLWDFV